MKIRLVDIDERGTELIISESISDADISAGRIPVSGIVKLFRDEDTVVVSGNVRAELEADCARCLSKFSTNIEVDMSLTLIPRSVSGKREEKQMLTQEEVNVGYYSDEEIDISSLLTEQIKLNVPIRTVCSDDCKGLCSLCGADLNKGQCECRKDQVDERWSKLRNLFRERKEE
ncbi:MAG: DUF177 domain-containing protein [Nitrospirota bacterium]|nr:MAG: DUF177 domain-containing protein [Nitrospirota bacterium]